jgi:phytanoyl-CoA hydroxylase
MPQIEGRLADFVKYLSARAMAACAPAWQDEIPTTAAEARSEMKTLEHALSKIADVFDRDGYYLAQGVYSDRALRQMEEDFDRIVAQLQRSGENVNARWGGAGMDELDGGASTVIHTHNVHRYSARWLHALQDEQFLAVAQTILGPDIVLHHSKLFQKPPRAGAPFPVHQDWSYFPTQKDSMVAATIFLTDADESMGGMRIYPGSHKLGRMVNSAGLQVSDSLRAYPLTQATAVNAKRGDVLFFSYFTLHGSSPNTSAQVRKTVLVQMYGGDDYVLENKEFNHVDEQLVLAGWNHRMTRALAAK